jgi:Ca-activated chloride channel homolog
MPVRAVVVGLAVSLAASVLGAQSRPDPAATFRSGVDLVRVAAVVRDSKGQPVTDLSRDDFVLLDGGERRSITDFRAGEGVVTLGVLLDVSGSMQIGPKTRDARQAIRQLLAWLQPGKDESALFTFDRDLRQLTPFTDDPNIIDRALNTDEPFGLTALHDAIAATARVVAAHGGTQRAVVVVTDGVDTGSHLTPAQVSGIASGIDVPVYVIAVVSPLDHPGGERAVAPASASPLSGSLLDLARWTGGDLFIVSAPAHASIAARRMLNELRHQYLIAFEPGTKPGWHALELRTRDRGYRVLARSGYIAGPTRPFS